MRTRMILTLAVAWLAWPHNALASPRLEAPAKGKLRVAFVMTQGATMIDFAGPWEVFQDVHIPERGDSMLQQMPFELYTVGVSKDAIRTSGGMAVVPDHTFADAPPPDIVVIGAQRGAPGLSEWVRKAHARKAVVMSVCTGAFVLAETGLLDGKSATTHHMAYNALAKEHPKIKVERSKRYVSADPRTFTSGGLTAGIDLALHVVALYFGDEAAKRTADFMEYESTGWHADAAGERTVAR